ncbi:12292_t:CDS:1, partial [Cetraspora pellucida]
MAADIKKLLLTVLKTLAFNNKEDFFSNYDIVYLFPESFSQIFGYTFSEEDIKEAIKQLQNEKVSFNGINGEIAFNENDRKLSLFKR